MGPINPSALDANHALLNVRGARASSVIVHRVPAGCAERFLEWQRGITRAAEVFSGYQATDEYPPTDSRQPDWVVVIHFDNSEALQRWLDSPARAEWIAKLPAEIVDFQLKTLSAGFGPWFAGLVDHGGLPPHWKMFLIVLLGLYPTVMLLTLFLSPHTNRFGLALAMLIGNAASVAFLEWLGMPVMSRLLGPWLRANGKKTRAFSLVGLALMLAALVAMTFVFHLVT
jgi:antibiotic biosynthesis monooxygenase (ABM) superfamily enzyme